jgi:hypothetical protein
LKKSNPPKGLSAAAKRWWWRLLDEHDITDAAGLLLLEQALRCFDRAEGARALLDADGAVVRDRWNQLKQHPAAAIERDSRSGTLQALRALNLDLEPLREAPGRPGGS